MKQAGRHVASSLFVYNMLNDEIFTNGEAEQWRRK